jgi:hypothetical protein
MPIINIPNIGDNIHGAYKVLLTKNIYKYKIGSLRSEKLAYNKARKQLSAMKIAQKKKRSSY